MKIYLPAFSLLSLVFLMLQPAYSQALRTINGKILSAENSPVPGLAVIQLGTENAVVTDINGQFELVVDDASEVFLHLFGLDLEIYLKYSDRDSSKVVYLGDWKQLKKNNRKVLNEWTAKNHN
jgi:hypothetical protein